MRTSQKKWERLSAVILTFALLLSMLPATAMAVSTGDKTIDNEVHYQVNGAIDAGVRYWSIEYDKVDTDGSILLNGSKFADRSNQWGLSNTEPYAGRFLLNFHRVEFYEQIQGVSIVSGNNVTEFDKEANGALWTVPINTRTWASGKIGVVTNSQIRITLKNGQTLESLQLENTPISFETFAVTGSGNPGGSSMMVNRSWDQGFILANNQNRKDEQKTGFLTGPMSNRISLDYNQLTGQMVIKSIHSFKPNVKMSTTDLYWVVYIKEQIPKELLPYIDTANIRLGATNEDGRGDKPGSEFRTDTPVTIDIDSNGLVDTSRVSAISIAQSDTRDALNAARNRLEKSVFSVTTGQNANFTIQYPLRENVSIRDFAIFLNQYITEHDNQLLFDSWLESDYPNEKDGYGLVYAGTLDHGAPYKHLTDSYANAYIPMNDSDKDGLWDFIENQVGSNMNLVDTDGDGVPDGSELLDDSTDPVDAADYKAAAPQTDSTVLYGGIENTIEGTAPKLVYQDPGDKVIEVPVTSQQAGNALVKLQGYDDTTNTFTDVIYGSAVIPFDQLQAGNFRIDLAKDALTVVAGEKVVLVSYSPNGKNPAMGVPLQVLHLDKVIPVDPNHPGTVPDGYVTVTFDPGRGSWKDGTKPSSYYVQKDVEVTPTDFQAVTDNLEAPADHIFSKWDGFPENGQFTADEQLTASFADSREIIEVTPKDPDQPFNPENADDGNNSQKTPQGFVRVIFESGEHGTFGTYAGSQDKVKVAYDVKAGQTWEKIAAPAVTAKPGYTAKSGAELWNPQLPGEAETVTGGTYTAQYTKLDKVIPVDPNHPGTVPDGYVTVTFDPGRGSWKDGTKPSSYYVQKGVEVTPADFQAVTDNLEAPADHIFSKWDGFPENGQFTADEQLTASFAGSREIIEVTPKDPDQPFHPENQDDGNNSQKTPQGFVRVIFESGEHGTFGTYAGGQDKVKVAYDVKADQTWAKVAVPAVTAKPGYTAKSGAERWNPQLPGEAETVTGGTYTAQYTKNSGGKVLWYQEIYLQNPDGTFSRWNYGHGGFAQPNTTVRINLTAFDGQKTAWGDTLGVEFVFDADHVQNRLSDMAENAGKQTPLRAYYKRAPHTVTYQYEGTVPDGAPTVPAKVDSWYGANVSIAEAPTLSGYVFSGWTTNTAGAVIDKGILTMPNTDVVLKGIWTKDVATTAVVTFRIANGTWADGSTADKQTLIRLHDGKGTLDAVSIPTGMKANSGYTGGVWDVQPNTSPDAVTGDVVYTYSFKPNKPGMTYRVMFKFVSLTKDENGQPKELPQAVQDLLPASITGLKRNDTVIYPILDKTSVSVADGTWVFAGWPGGTSATITGNILEVGGWRFEAAPKVFFPTMGIMIEGQRIDVPAEGPVGSNANLPEMFRPITVTLGTVERSFEADTVGGAGSPLTIGFTNYPDSEFSEGDYPIMVDNLPEGYTYELLVNDKAVQSPIRVDDNLSNIMLNIRKTYMLAYDTNGGNADGPIAQSGLLPDTYPLSTTKPTHASVDGRAVVWIGWTAEQDTTIYERGSASFDPSHLLTMVTISNKDETVYALWGYDENGNGTADVLEQTATITFRIANGTWADGSTADKQTLILLHEGKGTLDATSIPTGMKADSGYTGGTWDRQPDTTADAVTGNVVYTYSFHRSGGHGGNGGHSGDTRYTLTYVSNGGTEYKAERYDSGTTVKLGKTPMREGYLFTGWYADEKLTNEINRIQMTGNKTVYAGWEKNAPALHIPDMLNGDDHFAYVAGYTDGTVRPNAKITRAEVAMIFYRLLDEDVRVANENDSNAFSDVTDGMWFNTAVSTISRLGIVKGRSTEIFDPNAPITRAEFATICARFDHSKVESTESFSDIHGHWAEKFVEHAAALGWVNGYMDGTFRPNATITRAEAMAMINRVLGRLPESEKDLLPGMKTWPDNADPSAWYYLAVQEATNGHTFERKADGVHEQWSKLK